MKKFLGIGVVLGALAVGLFAYDLFVIRALERQMDASITRIEVSYANIVGSDVAAVRAEVTGSSAELTQAFGVTQTLVTRMKEDRDRIDRLNDIVKIQRALRKIEALVVAYEGITDLPSYAALRHSVGERGPVRAQLQEYNEHARQWNNHVQGSVSTASATVQSTQRMMLPYLRFDGEAEAEQKVGFGG